MTKSRLKRHVFWLAVAVTLCFVQWVNLEWLGLHWELFIAGGVMGLIIRSGEDSGTLGRDRGPSGGYAVPSELYPPEWRQLHRPRQTVANPTPPPKPPSP